MNVSYLHNMKFIQFIESILPQVIKMKKLVLCRLMKGPCHCLWLEIRISRNNYVFTHSTFNLCTRMWIFPFYYEKNHIYIYFLSFARQYMYEYFVWAVTVCHLDFKLCKLSEGWVGKVSYSLPNEATPSVWRNVLRNCCGSWPAFS